MESTQPRKTVNKKLGCDKAHIYDKPRVKMRGGGTPGGYIHPTRGKSWGISLEGKKLRVYL